jgi:hypothetical protein
MTSDVGGVFCGGDEPDGVDFDGLGWVTGGLDFCGFGVGDVVGVVEALVCGGEGGEGDD